MDARSGTLMRRTWLRQSLSVLIFAVLLFAPAGTLRFWQAWVFGAVFLGACVLLGVYFLKRDPALIERRMQAGTWAEQEPAQKIIIGLVMAGFLLQLVLPGLDHRWHWSSVPLWLVLGGDGAVAASFVVFFHVMKENSYAASTIRVEPGQPVVSTGLYGLVRHPMYSGTLILMVGTPLALGSYWSLLVLVLMLPLLAWRLLDEERVLRRDLPGYADYCRRVRHHLVPGVW